MKVMTDVVINPRLNLVSQNELLSSGYAEESIVKLPHYTGTAKELSNILNYDVPCEGLAFVYLNMDGTPMKQANGKPFVRVKLFRNPDDVAHYEETTGRRNGKYSAPTNGGCRFYFSPLLQTSWENIPSQVNKPIYFVEGEKKADVIAQEGFVPIGLGGVTSWKTKADNEDSAPIADFGLIDWKYRQVYLCPDSDVTDPDKPMIGHAMKNLAVHLESLGAKVNIIVLPNNLDGSKMGADDFIKQFGRAKFATFARFSRKALKNIGKSNKNPIWQLDLTEPDNQRKAEIVSWLLSNDYAVRPGNGFYRFDHSHWTPLYEKETIRFLQQAYDSQHWRLNSVGALKFAEDVISSLLLVPEGEWNKGFNLLFSNGTYNPMLKQFTPSFDRTTYGTIQPLSFPYTTIQNTPKRFLQFLNEATGGDNATIELLQAILRYVWIPKDRTKVFPIQSAFDFYGGKGTGKSTFIEVIMKGLGENSYGSADPAVFSTPEKLSALLDKRAAISTDCAGHLANVGTFNAVVSNEPVQVRTLYQQPVLTRLGIVVIRAYNKIISVSSSGTQGLDRRILAIEFNKQPKEVDTQLLQKLTKELPDIFWWCFSISDEEMVRRIESRNDSELAAKASIERFVDNNPVFQFLSDFYTDEGVDKILTKEIYGDFVEWCRQQNMCVLKQSTFFTSLMNYGCSYVKKADGEFKTQARYKFVTIPAMKNFDLKAHLRLGKAAPQPIQQPSAIADESTNSETVQLSPEEQKLFSDTLKAGFIPAAHPMGEYSMKRSNGKEDKEMFFSSFNDMRMEIDHRLEQQSPAGIEKIKQQVLQEMQQLADAGDLGAQLFMNDINDGSEELLENDPLILTKLGLM
jgi:P4 family phage/plasmid primase-like protien